MNALSITQLEAIQILDSRGYPTVHVLLTAADGSRVAASAPAGASTGAHEAAELRDGGRQWNGRGVTKAVASVNGPLAELLVDSSWDSIRVLDHAMRELDGMPDKSRLGANAIVAVSIAAARAFAHAASLPLHAWIAGELQAAQRLPIPHFNVLNGGAHAANELDFQEFMIAPVGAGSYSEAVRCGSEVYHALAVELRKRGLATGLGDEGGFAPEIARPEQALDLLLTAIDAAGYRAGVDADVAIAIDPAANGFYVDGAYTVGGTRYTSDGLVDLYQTLIEDYPIWSIEDGVAEDDDAGWRTISTRLKERVQIVGDDNLVTSPARILAAAEEGTVTAALIKVNQIGTVSETFDALTVSSEHRLGAMISHRSGETSDTFVADLAVGSGVGQLKSGAPARGERVAKYNRLLEIEHDDSALPYGLPEGRVAAASV